MVETLKQLIHDWVLHLDTSLGQVIQQYGTWTYAILFVVVFCETGLVVTPFLPGDSLLFFAGYFARLGNLDPAGLFVVIALAAIGGDTVNYWIGAAVGPRAFHSQSRFLRREYLDRTHQFFERHGGKAIILARFVPIIRTFAPFVAGIGAMNYRRFILYNIVGGLAWVGIFLGLGYWLGTWELLRDHPSSIAAVIVVISVMPMVVEYLRARRRKRLRITDSRSEI